MMIFSYRHTHSISFSLALVGVQESVTPYMKDL